MSFYRKYELDRLIADGDAKTFRAVENATGRFVFLHLFNPPGQPLLAALKSKLGGQGGKPHLPLIEIGEFAGSPYAVTLAVEPFTNLRDWIAANVSAASPLVDEDSSPSLAPTQEPTLPRRSLPADSGPLVPDNAKPSLAPPPFPPISSAPPVAPAPPAPSGLLSDGPGEFTRRFDPPAPTPPRVAPPPAVSKAPPGEFTRFFADPESEPPALAPPQRPSVPGGPEPGEFTRWFDPAAKAPVAPAPPTGGLVGDAPGEFTRLFENPSAPAAPASGGTKTDKPKSNPGEFTRFFQLSEVPQVQLNESQAAPPARNEPPPPLVPSASPPPATGARPSLWPPPSPDPSLDTGQFTRHFGPRLSGESIDIEKEHASAARSAVPENRPFQAAGEFTRMFGPQGPGADAPVRSSSPPPLTADSSLSSASGLFSDPRQLPKTGNQPGTGEPGEYTKFFDSPKAPPEAPKPVAPVAAVPEVAPATKVNRDTIILGVVAGLVLIVMIVVAVMLLKR